ncbi:MAG TPA: pathogenicity protein, partial [Rhodanobacteraceae bacterium]|nr:pathogenicity protein [Rhodanobacteraceae bacterium]
MTRARKWIAGIGIAIVALLVLLAIFFAWLLYTPSGLRFALDRGVALMHGQFSYASASGTLAGETIIHDLRYHDDSGDVLHVDSAIVGLQPLALLGRRLHIRYARIDGTDLTLGASSSSQSTSLQPPLTVVLNDTLLTRIDVHQAGKQVFAANSLAIAGIWSNDQLLIKQLDLHAPQGSASLNGVVALAPGYSGHGKAHLDWSQNGTRYIADLERQSDGSTALVHAHIASPLRTDLHATVKLSAGHAWTVALNAPAFDARALPFDLPASIKTLALDLRGYGDAQGGKLVGKLAINNRTLLLDPAQFRLQGNTLTFEPLRLRSPQIAGVATATGTVHLDANPISAALDLQWQDVLVPADIAGQTLATHGKAHFGGSAQSYSLDGALAIGPPDRLANLQLKLQGTPQQIALQTLKLVQKNGGLGASGTIGLQPQFSWKLDATARKFDPGALLAGWNGALDFSLATQGELTSRGPRATLKLDRVTGTLRQRSVNGSQADLRITPDNLLDGTLLLAVGHSRIRAQGQGGARTNATIALDIATLADWLPQASGALQGRFTVRGAWPKLAVNGQLHGKHLAMSGRSVDALQLTASIPDISRPGGDLNLALNSVHASGLDFDAAHLAAHGTAASHRLQFDARGPQLSAALALQGSWNAKSKSWSGTLHDLHFTPQGLPEWRQQQPAALSWKSGAASLSQLCLSAGEPSLCLAADRRADGTLTARYQLQRLPMQLLATLASNTEPLRASGALSGSGQLTLRADGSVNGNATIQASAGALAFASTPNNALLSWTGLTVDATASGQIQHVRLTGNLSDGGHVNGDFTLSGPEHALHGTVSANLRSLAFLEALSTEVANVRGTLGGRLTLGGTLSAPQFQGQIQTQNFAAELPRAGLKLHDGRFAIAGDAQGLLRIAGQIA